MSILDKEITELSLLIPLVPINLNILQIAKFLLLIVVLWIFGILLLLKLVILTSYSLMSSSILELIQVVLSLRNAKCFVFSLVLTHECIVNVVGTKRQFISLTIKFVLQEFLIRVLWGVLRVTPTMLRYFLFVKEVEGVIFLIGWWVWCLVVEEDYFVRSLGVSSLLLFLSTVNLH